MHWGRQWMSYLASKFDLGRSRQLWKLSVCSIVLQSDMLMNYGSQEKASEVWKSFSDQIQGGSPRVGTARVCNLSSRS